jgi:uncharacterized cupin superfamily protein
MFVSNWHITTFNKGKIKFEKSNIKNIYIVMGRIKITIDNNKEVEIERGDYVTLPNNLKCSWNVTEGVVANVTFYR